MEGNGLVCLAGLAMLCHEKGVPLLVDEAHGGHFAFAEQFPQVFELPLQALS